MLVECGFTRAQVSDGREWTFTPSLAGIAALGSPTEIVSIYAGLHGPAAPHHAAYVLATLCDQEDCSDLIGWTGLAANGRALEQYPGLMPADEQVIIARHLMQHGIAGKARPGQPGGSYSPRFDAAEYVSAARVHLGLSSADAEALSMTEFQTMLEMKHPAAGRKRDLPTREEYHASKKRFLELRGG